MGASSAADLLLLLISGEAKDKRPLRGAIAARSILLLRILDEEASFLNLAPAVLEYDAALLVLFSMRA